MQQEPGKPVQPVKTMGPLKFFAIIGAGFGALLLCSVLFNLVRPDTAPSGQAVAEPAVDLRVAPENWVTVAPDPTKAPKPTATPLPGIGDEIVLSGVTLQVVTAENTGQAFSNAERETPLETTGMFVWLSVQITNTGADPIALHTPKLIDSAGREFNPHEDQWLYIPNNESCALDTLNPGLYKTCSNLYELPADATGLAAMLKTSLFSDGVRVNLAP